MVNPIINLKIDSLSRCLKRIDDKRPATLDILQNDLDLQDIISINLERAVQQCIDIAMILLSDQEAPVPATMSEAFSELFEGKLISEKTAENMIRAVGFRNLIVHAYKKIDWNIVWDIISIHLVDFRLFAKEVVNSNS